MEALDNSSAPVTATPSADEPSTQKAQCEARFRADVTAERLTSRVPRLIGEENPGKKTRLVFPVKQACRPLTCAVGHGVGRGQPQGLGRGVSRLVSRSRDLCSWCVCVRGVCVLCVCVWLLLVGLDSGLWCV